MWITKTIADLRQARRQLVGQVALVPTMGALHEGHLSLMHHAREQADHVLVSIFVNPAQFGPSEDFQQYPRTLEADLQACQSAGVDGVFCPMDEQMYPARVPACEVSVPSLSATLEGAIRPGHFAGVCRVVAKLFGLFQPDVACFGQKDYQQLCVIQAMVDDLNMPVRIVACPTLREPDGLAMSSRNRYLSPQQRRHAIGLFKALGEARLLIQESGETDPQVVQQAMQQTMQAYQLAVDYAAVRHPQTLGELDCIEPGATGQVVALVAGRLGRVRLIDNMVMNVLAR